jgi:hypothetical protein
MTSAQLPCPHSDVPLAPPTPAVLSIQHDLWELTGVKLLLLLLLLLLSSERRSGVRSVTPSTQSDVLLPLPAAAT